MPGARTPRGPRRSPAERVRARLRAAAGDRAADAMPPGYQRLGRVLVLRLPDALAPWFGEIGRAWQEELGVATVLVRTGPISGELREPAVRRIAGGGTETEVVEYGVRWRFDAARLMFAAGNRTERRRLGALVRPGEHVVDLFAGIGYFAIPIARSDPGVRVTAVEKNPVAHGYLVDNACLNGVADRIDARLGDNRREPSGGPPADRVILGYLPDATPWVGRALELAAPEGAWLHVHTVADARGAVERARAATARAVEAAGGRAIGTSAARAVKPYGPGRTHVVVDVRAAPVR